MSKLKWMTTFRKEDLITHKKCINKAKTCQRLKLLDKLIKRKWMFRRRKRFFSYFKDTLLGILLAIELLHLSQVRE